jgi:hypothetical protein
MGSLFSSGNKGDSEGDSHDTTHWDRGTSSSDGAQVNHYVGKNDSDGSHCHMWSNSDSGTSGVVHRGECKVCDDGNGGSNSANDSK